MCHLCALSGIFGGAEGWGQPARAVVMADGEERAAGGCVLCWEDTGLRGHWAQPPTKQKPRAAIISRLSSTPLALRSGTGPVSPWEGGA